MLYGAVAERGIMDIMNLASESSQGHSCLLVGEACLGMEPRQI